MERYGERYGELGKGSLGQSEVSEVRVYGPEMKQDSIN